MCPLSHFSVQVSSFLVCLPELFRWVGVEILPLLPEQPAEGACDDEQGSDVHSIIIIVGEMP